MHGGGCESPSGNPRIWIFTWKSAAAGCGFIQTLCNHTSRGSKMNISMKLLPITAVFGVVICLQGCISASSATGDSPMAPASFTVLVTSPDGQADRRKLEIIRSQQDFNAAYHEVLPDAGLAPSVDFNQSIVIGAYLGTQSTGGYSIAVETVNVTESYVEVNVKSTAPGSTCITSQSLTSPFQFVAIAKTTKPVIFKESYAVLNC